jgi:hypothetical protein
MMPRSASSRGPVRALVVVAVVGAVTLTPTAAQARTTAGPAGAGTSASAAGAGIATSLPQRIDLPAGFQPEGIAASADGRLYVGSIADGRIWTVDPGQSAGRDLVPAVAGRAVIGMIVDERTGWLWAGAKDADGGLVLAVDTRTGAVRTTVRVPDAGLLNDLVVVRDAVWVTDSYVDRLVRIPLDVRGNLAGAYTTVPLGGAWPSGGNDLRGNGIRALPDGRLLLDHTTAGGLFTVDPLTGTATAVPVTGTPPIVSGDGMVLRGRQLLVVRGTGTSTLTDVRLEGAGTNLKATVVGTLADQALDVPSTAAVAKGRLWVVNARFGVADPTTAPYWITRLS